MILSVDPSIRYCGAALFPIGNRDGGEVYRAVLVKNPVKQGHGIEAAFAMAKAVENWVGPLHRITSVVIERMKVYPGRRTPGDPNKSLLPLVGVAYMIAARFPWAAHHEFEAPRDWKGTIDGIEVTRRVRERLTPEEFAAVSLPPSACAECRKQFGAYCVKGERGCGADHVYDAVGIGLKHLGRFERTRVIAR